MIKIDRKFIKLKEGYFKPRTGIFLLHHEKTEEIILVNIEDPNPPQTVVYGVVLREGKDEFSKMGESTQIDNIGLKEIESAYQVLKVGRPPIYV